MIQRRDVQRVNKPECDPERGGDINPPYTPKAVHKGLVAVFISVVNEVDCDVDESGRRHGHSREIKGMSWVVDGLADLLRPDNKANEGHEGEDAKKQQIEE